MSRLHSSARRAKSPDRMDGAMRARSGAPLPWLGVVVAVAAAVAMFRCEQWTVAAVVRTAAIRRGRGRGRGRRVRRRSGRRSSSAVVVGEKLNGRMDRWMTAQHSTGKGSRSLSNARRMRMDDEDEDGAAIRASPRLALPLCASPPHQRPSVCVRLLVRW